LPLLDADGTITYVDDGGDLAHAACRADKINRGGPGVRCRPAAQHRGFDDD